MTDRVRVRDNETGHHFTIPRSRYDLNPSAYTELKSDATNPDGTDVRPKYKTTVDQKATDKTAAKSAGTEKEQ